MIAQEVPSIAARLESPWLGEIGWNEEDEMHFAAGLPGFERCRRMVPVEIPSQRPLIYLQSAENEQVCFLTLPVRIIRPDFDLHLSEDDAALLSVTESPAIGEEVLCLALLAPCGGSVQTNLDTPIVISLHNRRGVQAIVNRGEQSARGWFRLNEASRWEPVC